MGVTSRAITFQSSSRLTGGRSAGRWAAIDWYLCTDWWSVSVIMQRDGIFSLRIEARIGWQPINWCSIITLCTYYCVTSSLPIRSFNYERSGIIITKSCDSDRNDSDLQEQGDRSGSNCSRWFHTPLHSAGRYFGQTNEPCWSTLSCFASLGLHSSHNVHNINSQKIPQHT